MHSANSINQLLEIVGRLKPVQFGQLLQIAEALACPIESGVNLEAGYITAKFADEFEARLLAHHGTHSKQLDRIGLEDAFRAASRADGRNVSDPMGATRRFIDEIIDGENIALKSIAAKDVRSHVVHISKLCEAAWIQDVRGAQPRSDAAKGQIREYLGEVDRMFQLRVLPDRLRWRYQLVEIPLSLFRPILDLDRAFFAPDGPRIAVSDSQGPCLTLVLDRSDAKITIAKIPIARCVVHAEWNMAKKAGDNGYVAATDGVRD